MRNFKQLKTALPDSARVQVQCPCNYNATFESFDAFEASGGAIQSETPLIIRCPGCQSVYVATARQVSSTVEFELEKGSTDRSIPATPLGECPECGGQIMSDDYSEGSDHPTIGWRYYECSHCNAGIHPNLFN